MRFHSLIAAALLLACVAGVAGLASIATAEREPAADAGASSLYPSPAREASEGSEASEAYVTVYRNGDLELNLRGTPGIDILRSGLAGLFQDDHPATPHAWPQQEPERRICAEQTGKAGKALLDAVPASEPLSMGMLGAGFALMGWTRRRGSWFDKIKGGQGWRFDVLPWPALCWLD